MSGIECSLVVQEAAEEQVVLERIDVREADQVADDRADRRSASASRRQVAELAAGTIAADLDRDLPRQLEQIAVEQEEAGQLVVAR